MRIEDLLGKSGTMLNVQNLNIIVSPEEDTKPSNAVVVSADGGSNKDVVNPGIEYGENGQAKWSPPLQQQLSVIKGAVGTTTDDPTVEPSDEEKDDLVAARNNSGSASNSAVTDVNDEISDDDEEEFESSDTSDSVDIISRIKQLAGLNKQKSSPTSNAATFLTRNFP